MPGTSRRFNPVMAGGTIDLPRDLGITPPGHLVRPWFLAITGEIVRQLTSTAGILRMTSLPNGNAWQSGAVAVVQSRFLTLSASRRRQADVSPFGRTTSMRERPGSSLAAARTLASSPLVLTLYPLPEPMTSGIR